MDSDTQQFITKPNRTSETLLPTEPPEGGDLVPVPGTDRRIVIAPALRGIDTSVVAFPFYNSFNYSILSGHRTKVQLTVGITSPNRGEGKTLTASNLAMSLTLGYRKKTVLVDLNFQSPRVHDIFGTTPGPGLLEALEGAPLRVSATRVEHLHVLTAGNPEGSPAGAAFRPRTGHARGSGSRHHPVGIERTAEFGEIIGALKREFSFIIVDMPAINNRDFPILFVDPLDGVLVVTEPGRTRRRDITRMFRHLHRNQVLGFIFNRVKDENEC